MDEDAVNEKVQNLARALKAFLEGLDAAGETLHSLTEAGYELYVLVTVDRRGGIAARPAYLLEIVSNDDSQQPGDEDLASPTASVEEFLQSLDP